MQRKAADEKKKKIGKGLVISALVLGALSGLCYTQNNTLQITNEIFASVKVPSEFDGFKILHISDLHGKSFGREQKRLIAAIKKQQPDLIILSGDIVDSRRLEITPGVKLIEQAQQIAPVYYVCGNHEARSEEYELILKRFTEAGAVVLSDTNTVIKKGAGEILLCGINDPILTNLDASEADDIAASLKKAVPYSDARLKLLIAHRPEFFEEYARAGADIIFSGHTHGGQIRLPFIGGIIAPNQGWFPLYDKGAFTLEGASMYVSAGLGNSLFPQRVFNFPHIITLTLSSGEEPAEL